MTMLLPPFARVFLTTLFYTLFGLVVFLIAFWGIVKISPFSIRKEIEDDQNVALAIIIAAVVLGIALIIASTIHG